jgi:hypothetical protein
LMSVTQDRLTEPRQRTGMTRAHWVSLAFAPALGEFGHFVGIKGLVVGGLDDPAEVLGDGAAGLAADVRREAARGAGGLGDLRAQVHGDLVIGFDLGGHGLDTPVLGLRQVGAARRNLLPWSSAFVCEILEESGVFLETNS